MLKGIFLIIGAATCWGMGGVAGQYLYQYHQADMIWLCMARQILAGCMFLLYVPAFCGLCAEAGYLCYS